MSTAQAPPSLQTETILFQPSVHAHLLPSLVQAHATTVLADHTLLRFLPPFTPAKRAQMLAWWRVRLVDGAAQGDRAAIIEVTRPEPAGSADSATLDGGRDEEGLVEDEGRMWREQQVVGIVVLELDPAETGPFRAGVELLLVDPAFRRRGVARRLMERLEEVAREDGRSLLVSLFAEKRDIVSCLYS